METTAKQVSHTPGPWKIMQDGRKLRGGRGMAYDVFGDCNRPSECQEYVCGKATEANARLIAAAPELLAALKVITRTADTAQWLADHDRYALAQANWAIAQATGDR